MSESKFRNILLTIQYDGKNFCGWQRQPNALTVQGEIERVLSLICNKPVLVNGVSRTDAGVHAFAQKASFAGEFSIPTANITRAANSLLKEGIIILKAEEVDEKFHARFDCTGKKYIYKIVNGKYFSPFDINRAYHVRKPLDVEAMKEAFDFMLGTHDFKSFEAAASAPRLSTVRTISEVGINVKVYRPGECVELEEDGQSREITIEVVGDGFLYNMVRIITGTLVDVGLGKIDPGKIPNILRSLDRRAAGHTAPPCGLYLKEVYYG